MSRFWIGVASAEHVRRGRAAGYMQLCHGKAAPLRRLQPGDGIVYYSPSDIFGGKPGYSAFTALGEVLPEAPYVVDCGGGFVPHRRNVAWRETTETPIRPLLEQLDFTRGKRNWGYQLRFGIFEIGGEDFERIADAMGAPVITPSGSSPPPPQ